MLCLGPIVRGVRTLSLTPSGPISLPLLNDGWHRELSVPVRFAPGCPEP